MGEELCWRIVFAIAFVLLGYFSTALVLEYKRQKAKKKSKMRPESIIWFRRQDLVLYQKENLLKLSPESRARLSAAIDELNWVLGEDKTVN